MNIHRSATAIVFCISSVMTWGQQGLSAAISTAVKSGTDSASQQVSSAINSQTGELLSERSILAMSEPDYPVTAGDIYALTYLRSSTPDTIRLVVEGDSTVNLGFFGRFPAAGLRFRDFKALVEKKVADGYPGSNPSLLIVSPGIFQVLVEGEVAKAGFLEAWGLSRLSTFLSLATSRASIRAVTIIGSKGDKHSYDLFLAGRQARIDQDPYIKPGDRILLGRADRIVTIGGAVERPGTYQLLPGETLRDIVSVYGGGLAERADSSRIDLVRYVGSIDPTGDRRLIDYSKSPNTDLNNLDVVTVPSLQDFLPIVFFEGAVNIAPASAQTKLEPGISNRFPYRFLDGELLSSAIRANQSRLTAEADLERGYVLRDGKRIYIDFSHYLYSKDFKDDYVLESADTIVIPFKQYFVTVGGAVMLPGRYPFVPDRGWRYYVGLAGGSNQELNTNGAHKIYNSDGSEKSADAPIKPEDSIVVASNSFFFYLSKVSSILTPITAILTVYLSLKPYLP